MNRAELINTLHQVTTPIIYLMGFCFILGSLVTILLLLLLDWAKRSKGGEDKGQPH